LVWAREHGFEVSIRAIERRVAKIDEARGVAPRKAS
jgi:hypothetical protein